MGITRIVPDLPVSDVSRASARYADAVHARVIAAGLEVVHPPTDDPPPATPPLAGVPPLWGVHRFFFRDPDGNLVNVVAHRQ